MRGESEITEIEPELAMAVGLVAITNASLSEAATQAGVSRWQLEECLQASSLTETLDVDIDRDLKAEIDRYFEERSG